MTTIDTPQGMQWFQFLQHYHGIKLQAEQGLTHSRGSLIKSAHGLYGIKGRTAKKALAEMQVIKDDYEAALYGDSDDAR